MVRNDLRKLENKNNDDVHLTSLKGVHNLNLEHYQTIVTRDYSRLVKRQGRKEGKKEGGGSKPVIIGAKRP